MKLALYKHQLPITIPRLHVSFPYYKRCAGCRWHPRCWSTQRFREFRYSCAKILFDRLDDDIERRNATIFIESAPTPREALVLFFQNLWPALALSVRVFIEVLKRTAVRPPAAFSCGFGSGIRGNIVEITRK